MNTVPSRIVVLLLLLTSSLTIVNAQNAYTLDVPPSFGNNGDGSIRPGDSIGTSPRTGNDVQICAPGGIGMQPGDLTASPNQTNGFNQRGISYDPITGNLIFVDTRTGSGGSQVMTPNSAVYILDSNSGQIVGTLNTNGIVANGGGGIGCIVTAGVADDGAIYVMNQVNNSGVTNATIIYRWPTANPTAPNFNDQPTLAFSNSLEVAERLVQTMDVRGAGTNTQIIVGTSSVQGATPGTNCWIFTTADGTNFVQHRLYFPGITTANFNDGITFGAGNTFFAKQVGKPLLVLSWDPVTFAGSVIATYTPSSPNDPLLNLSSITYDPTTKLLGALEEIGGTATGGPGRVWLFDFFDPTNRAPAVLASRVYAANFQKTTAPMGYVKFGGGKLFAHASNNGFLVSLVDSAFIFAPTFTEDLPQTNKVPVALSAHFEVQAVYDVTNYQWYSNNVAIPGANTYFYDITNVQSSMNNSVFKVTAYNANSSVTSTPCTLKVVDPSDFFHLTPLWSVVAGTTNYSTTAGSSGGTPNERCIAYNSLSNQLLVAYGPSGKVPAVWVVDASTGQYLYRLNTNNVSGGSTLTLAGIAVADDGAVYACNAANNTTFRIYRWADTGSNTQASVIFGTNSVSGAYNPIEDLVGDVFYRFGDNMSVRGSGMDTELVLDAQNNTKYAAILHPADSTMTNWSSTGYLLQNTPGSYGYQAYGTAVGRSLQFGQTAGTFWQKRYNGAAGAPLAQMEYTAGGGLSQLVLANTTLPIYTNGPVGINFALHLGAAINFVGSVGTAQTIPDLLSYYDMSDPTQAVLLSQTPLVGAHSGGHAANNNAIGQVIFGTSPQGSNYLFVINGNNGINAYVLEGGAVPPPTVLIQPHNLRMLTGSSNAISTTLDQLCNVTWYKGTNPAVNTGVTGSVYPFGNAQSTDTGDYFAIANNGNGAVTTAVAHVSVADASQFPTLSPLWTAPAGNASFPYITSSGGPNAPSERAFAYNPVNNQLIVVHCPPASTAYSLAVVDASTGSQLYTLNTTGVIHEGPSEVSGSNPIDLVGAACADDGALYICCETPNASGGSLSDPTKMFHVFRWADTGASTSPTVVFEGDPSGQGPDVNLRWGDVLTARGAGTNTELFLNCFDGSFCAVLRPTNNAVTGFTNLFFGDIAGGGSIGRSVQFGPGDSAFEKRRGNFLVYSSYTLSNQTANLIFDTPSTSTLGGVAIDLTQNIAAGVDFLGSSKAPDAVALYDITDPSSPLLLNEYNFPNNQVPNNNSICQTLIVSNRVYALDANNGLLAFNIVPPASSNPPALTISLSGQNVIVSWPQQGSFTLQGAASLTAPINWTDIGTGTAANGQYVVTNSISQTETFYRLRQ